MDTNPFPGMNPYLERHWGDVHLSLVVYGSTALNRQLPEPLRARVGGRSTVYADRAPDADDGDEPDPVTRIRILDPSAGGRVVTVVDFLVPADKRPGRTHAGHDGHPADRAADGGTRNLVEVDILRGGDRAIPARHDAPAGGYAVRVRRADRPHEDEVYRFGLRDRLPVVRVPLRASDPDATLDIQVLVDRAYVSGRYDDVDHRLPLDPPLSAADAEWVTGMLAATASAAAPPIA